MTAIEPSPITLHSSAELIASVPFLLGFHPTDSIVVIAMLEGRVEFVARGDLPGQGSLPAIAHRMVSVLMRDDIDTVVLVGYGTTRLVTPALDAVRAALTVTDIHALDVLRVEDGRYWSLVCSDPRCCPPEGKPYDPSSSAIGAAAVYAGRVALADRGAVAESIAPVDGSAREAMTLATIRADGRLTALIERARAEAGADSAPAGGAGSAVRANARVARVLRAAGDEAVDAAVDRYRAGARLTDDEVAWLSVLLVHLPVRDHAWEHTTDDEWQVDLWSDVVRRVDVDLVVAPASLLGFAAWRAGQGALASLAVDRALAVDPDYAMAQLLDEVLEQCIPPSVMIEADDPLPGPIHDRGWGQRNRKDRRQRVRRDGLGKAS